MIEYKVGDTVYADFSHFGIVVRVGTVVKITPTGRVNVTFAEGFSGQFDKNGRIIGNSFSYAQLIDEARYDRLIKFREQQRINNIMRKVLSADPEIRSDKVLIAVLIEKLTEMAEVLK